MWRWTPTEEEAEEEEEEEEEVEAEAGAARREGVREGQSRARVSAWNAHTAREQGGRVQCLPLCATTRRATYSFRVGCASFARRARVCAREFVQNES